MCFPNESIISLCKKHLKKHIVKHINKNSLRNKSELFIKQIEGYIDILTISETKAFQSASFRLMDTALTFRFDCNGNSGGVMLFVRNDIPVKLIGSDKLPIESFYMEINLSGQKWLINTTNLRL